MLSAASSSYVAGTLGGSAFGDPVEYVGTDPVLIARKLAGLNPDGSQPATLSSAQLNVNLAKIDPVKAAFAGDAGECCRERVDELSYRLASDAGILIVCEHDVEIGFVIHSAAAEFAQPENG